MSGPLQASILAAISAIVQSDPKTLKIAADPNKTAQENVAALGSALCRVRAELRMVEMQVDDLRAALSSWADLTRKMADVAREKEEAICASFRAKEKPQDWLSHGVTIVRELRDVERNIDLALTLERIKIPATPTGARASSSSSSSDSDEIELERGKPIVFDGHSENWPEFRASFELTVKKKYSSPEIRMYYLRRYLAEQPKKVIAGYGGDEFDEAWDELETKYWDKSGYVRKLHFQLANIKNAEITKTSRDFSSR